MGQSSSSPSFQFDPPAVEDYFKRNPEARQKLLLTGAQKITDGTKENSVGELLMGIREGGGQQKRGITVNGSMQREYTSELHKRISFKVEVNPETNKLEIIGRNGKALNDTQLEAFGKTLKEVDRAVFDAITDKQHHMTIETGDGKDNPSVFFGREMGATHHIDFADLAKLDKAKVALSGADVVLHETLEAHAQAKGDSFNKAHISTLKYGPALGVQRSSQQQKHFNEKGLITGTTTPWSIDGKIVNGKPEFLGFVNVKVQFPEPIRQGEPAPRDAKVVDVSQVARARDPRDPR